MLTGDLFRGTAAIVPNVVRSCRPEIFKVEVDKVEGPKIIGKINIHNIDSSTRPKYPKKKQRYDKMPRDRDDLDSGWGTTMRAIQINFKKGNK